MNRVFYRYVAINYRAILGTLAAVCFRKISCIYRKLAPNVYIVVTFGLILLMQYFSSFSFVEYCWDFQFVLWDLALPLSLSARFFPPGICLPLLVYYWDFVLHPSAYYWNFLPPGIPPPLPGILSYIRLLMTPLSVPQCCSLRRSDTWVK